MRVEIDIKELAGELWSRLRSEIDEARSETLPALLSRKDAAHYLGISPRMLDHLGIPRIEISDRCIRYRREDLERLTAERIRA